MLDFNTIIEMVYNTRGVLVGIRINTKKYIAIYVNIIQKIYLFDHRLKDMLSFKNAFKSMIVEDLTVRFY